MKFHILSFVVILLVVVAVDQGLAQSSAETRFSNRVSQRQLLETVRQLVRLGPRMGGTDSGDKAFAYIAKRFRSLGVDVEVVVDPEKLAFTNRRWNLSVVEPKSLKKLIRHEWLAGFSPTVKPTKSPLVYVGKDQDLEEMELQGVAVLIDRAVSQKAYERFVGAGVTSLLLISPKMEGAYSDWSLITSLRPAMDNAIPLFNLSYRNGDSLRSVLKGGREVVIHFSSETTIARGSPKTVVATLKGKEDEYFIICAHGDSDSGGPGADDNASGVAGVLEIARVLQSLIQSKVIPPPSKSIKFIVWGSEYFSSEHYVKKHRDGLKDILGVINFDEIGTGATRNCLYFESNDVEHNKELLHTLQTIGEQYAGKSGFWEEATTNPSQGGTDSYVFLPDYLKHLKLPDVKIPSTTIYTGAWNEAKTIPQTKGWQAQSWKGHPDSVTVDFSAYYHSSLDIPALTTEREPFNMVWAVKAVGISLLRLAW